MKNNNYDALAVSFLKMIDDCVEKSQTSAPKIKTAIVESINSNGTVNVRFPETDNIWSNVQNQSIYQDLRPGDGVKLMIQDSETKNCWITGVNQSTNKTNILSKSSEDLDETKAQMDRAFQSISLKKCIVTTNDPTQNPKDFQNGTVIIKKGDPNKLYIKINDELYSF